jgi:predicted RNase H-like HicB family nuclease
MNLANPARTSHEVTVTLMLEPQASGGYVVSVMEFPDCRVEAETKEAAIEQIKQHWQTLLDRAEFIPFSLPISLPETTLTEPSWVKFAGIFQDNPDFAAIMDELRAERESDDESELDPAYYLGA